MGIITIVLEVCRQFGIYRCLRENYAIGAALDAHRTRDGQVRTATVQMFDRPLDCIVGPIKIARRCKSGVLQGLIVSEKNFHYRLELHSLPVERDAPESDELLQSIMQAYAKNIEAYALKQPNHISRA